MVLMFNRALWLAGLLILGAAGSHGEDFDVRAHYQKFEFRVPMRDGKRLFTAVYAPRNTAARYPILLTRTPYGVEPYGPDKYRKRLGPSRKFDEDGFIFVFQDVRGRYMSEGAWIEMTPAKEHSLKAQIDESTDCYDTIEWLLKNIPNNNGKVGTVGISYPGFYTTAGLIDAHPALVASSPQAPIADLYMGDDAYHNGALFLIANFSFYLDFPKQDNPVFPSDDKPFHYGTKDGYKFYLKLGSLMNSEKYFDGANPYWTDVMRHTSYDEFWKARDILPHLRDIKPAVLVVGGWFDAEDLAGTLKTYRAIRSQSPQTSDKLVMGPWVHGGWQRGPGDKLGEITFGSKTAEYFQDNIALPFFQHYVKGAADPKIPAASMFETGKNVWKKFDSWPPSDSKPQRLYFRASGALSETAPAEESGYDEYTSDPNHPTPFFEKPTLDMEQSYMDADQRFVERRPDVLTFQTAPLSEDMTMAGPVLPTLFVSTSGTDSDFVVKLIDVYPESSDGKLSGYEQLVRGEPFRGKFRHGFETPQPFEPNRVEQIQFAMPDVYHCFGKGHRVMVQIQSSWFPLVDRNPQIFIDIPTAHGSDFKKATERLYRSKAAASYIEVPVEPSK